MIVSCYLPNTQTLWSSALRALSNPDQQPDTARMPEFMRTQAFGLATANTQLGSWTELRHDTILYVKQGFGYRTLCGYPAGYVDPRVAFWQAMRDMIQRMRSVLGAHLNGIEQYIAHLTRFDSTIASPHEIATAQLNRTPRTDAQTLFLKSVVTKHETQGSGARTWYEGWYPKLFMSSRSEEFLREEYIVADVFTDPSCMSVRGVSVR